jgi:hypothetical protein
MRNEYYKTNGKNKVEKDKAAEESRFEEASHLCNSGLHKTVGFGYWIFKTMN